MAAPQTPLRGNRSAFAVAKHRMGADGYNQPGKVPKPAPAAEPVRDQEGAGGAAPDDSAGPAAGVLVWASYKDPEIKYTYEGSLLKVREAGGASAPTPATHVRHHPGDTPPATFTYPGGDFYEGPWRNGKKHGARGVLKLANGYRYEGEFEGDVPQGKGGEIFTHNQYLKCDHYERGRPNKTGTLFYAPRDGRAHHYHGAFRNGRRHGKGVIHYPNGDVFKGSWDDGKRHGEGVTYYAENQRKFATVWKHDKLTSGPTEVTGAHELDTLDVGAEEPPAVGASVGYAPADLTKWKVQDGVTDLSLEHFHRLNAGFELLDVGCQGELSVVELTRLWGSKDPKLLKRLDRNKDGHVDMYEVLMEWYPNVRKTQLLRFVDIEPAIANVWRLRGKLAGATHPQRDGFYCIAAEGVLTKDVLSERANLLGGETFSQVLWGRAVGLRDPPGFVDVLEAWYPNTPRYVLERFDMPRVAYDELEACRAAFEALDMDGSGWLDVDVLVEARAVKREAMCGKAVAPAPALAPLVNSLSQYFFKAEPCWSFGDHIRLTVPMAQEVLEFTKAAGRAPPKPSQISLGDLLHYSFPALPCRVVRAALGAPRGREEVCTCDVCAFLRTHRIAESAGVM
eukprot:TRINITY_DN29994_c0_g1_i1.p1 TRINITY_DN29994_c0_g1~~TRINITY_DN29994_c0_g1_i1.p1  ORF type:complete len:639 (+),score=230.63 TRINITY_DN29994_c0_g1_i1:52-1917(+)